MLLCKRQELEVFSEFWVSLHGLSCLGQAVLVELGKSGRASAGTSLLFLITGAK